MRSILFFIPHRIGDVPLFGVGIVLGVLVLAFCSYAIWLILRKQPVAQLAGAAPMFLIAAAVAVFIVPRIEQVASDGTAIGLPVRGYGIMVLAGLLSGVFITCWRGSKLGIDSDTVIGLGFWMMLVGVLGARVFWVVQNWQQLAGTSVTAKLVDAMKVTEGGLVIYGGVAGGLLGGWLYCRRHNLPILSTADLIAPGFLIGLAFGRIGCLLHGCCFGGVCEASLPTISFPHGSVPYQAQLNEGSLLGFDMTNKRLPGPVASLTPEGPAARSGLRSGDSVSNILTHIVASEPTAEGAMAPSVFAEIQTERGSVRVLPKDMPKHSLPVHPSQIYSAINAALLALLVWHFQPLPRNDGTVFFVAILLYAVARFVLECVRSDEPGQLGTPFTISQLIAMASGGIALLAILALSRMSHGRAWRW